MSDSEGDSEGNLLRTVDEQKILNLFLGKVLHRIEDLALKLNIFG